MSNINSLIKCRPEKGKKAVKRSIAAVILAFAMTGCIALAAMSDLVSNFLSMVVMVIARIILQLCDLIMNPLLEITQMTTEEVAEYIPGFAMSGDGVGGYFAKAIMVIATTIAGALIAVRIISYLLEIADGARTESVAKLIWNAVFGMVLTLTGSHFLQLMFDEIISPLTKALSEGVSGGGLGNFSFEKAGMSIIDLTESGDTTETIIAWMGGFALAQAAALVVSVVLLFLIWWNLVKLVLECAERYIICVFTILLSPLAFATATNERTKDTAINWMQMFWSQCVLLILNIWVVGIARTALDIGLVGASIDSVVKWGLITYAYLKIAQKLDDLLAKAGFRITSTTGLDPMSEAIGTFSVLKTGAHDILSLAGGVAGRGRAAFEALSSFIGGADNSPPIATNPVTPAGPGGAPSGSSSDFNKYGKVSFGDKEKADRFVRSTNAERSDIYKNPGETFNSNSNRQAMANALDELGFDGGKVSQGTVEDLAPDNAIKGAVNGKVTYRDENGKITGVSGFRYSSDESGTTATKTSDLAISPDGQSAILTTDKGKFRLENTGRTAANGSQEWTATRMTDGKGRSLGDVIPDTKNSTSFSVSAGQLNKYGADGAAAIAARSAMEGKNLDYLTRTTDSALNKHDQEQAAAVARDAKQAEAQKRFDTAKENYAGRFQMSNEQRAAEMRDPDSAVDYNSSESLAAMQDTLANADPALAEQFANGAKVTGVDMAMSRDDMPDGALTVTVGDGNTTDTYMVSNPKSSLTDEEAAQVIASGQLPNGTAQNAENTDGVAGGPNNASAAENGTDAAKTEAAMPNEDGNIAYNSLAGDDNEQEVTGEEVGDTVGMTSEAFEAMHTPMTWMNEPEADESEAGAPPTMWEYFAAMFSGRYSRNNSAQPTYVHVVNPDGVNYKSGAAAPNAANAANAANGTTTNANGTGKAAAGSGAPTDKGAPTPQNATASATGATGSVNTAQNGNTTDATSTTVGGAVSRFFGGGNTQAVHNPDVSGKDSNATTTETATAQNAANITNGTTINANGADNTAVGGAAPHAPGGQAQNVSTKPAPSSESQGNSEISAGGNGAAGEGNTVVISSPAQGSNATQAKDTTPSEHVETETSADSSATSTVTQSASEDSITDSNAGQTETVVGDSSVGPATQSATDKTVTEEGPAPTTAPASPDNSDSAANDSTVSVESPAGSAPGEEVAGPAKQATSHGSADAEYTDSDTPTGNGAVNEGSSSVGSEVQLVDDSSDTVQTNAPAQTENAAGAAANDSATGDASADYAEPPADADNASGNGAVTENSGSADSETQFTDDSSATVQANAPTSRADDVSGGGSADYVEPPANADNISGSGAAPVVQHTDSEPVAEESNDSDASSGYTGGTTDADVGSADSDASLVNSSSATVETHAPASYADRTVDTDDEAAGNAGSDYAAPSAQRTDSDDVSGEGNTGFAGGNGGGDNYSSDEETAPTAQGVKAPADEDDSGIGEPPAKGESSSNVGGAAGHTTSAADDSDVSDDSDAGSGSFGGNGGSHDENPSSGAFNDDTAAPMAQQQGGGDNSSDTNDSSGGNGGSTVNAPAAPVPESQGDGAVNPENSGSGNGGSAGQSNPATPATEDAAPTKTAPKATTETPKTDENPAPVAQNGNQGDAGGNAGDSGDTDSPATRKQPIEKPPVDGTKYFGDTAHANSFAESGTSDDGPRTSNGPEIRPLSHLSVKAFNDTNGFVESDGIGRIQVTRVSVDPDTGITQWRIMQKLDADGNVPETPDVMNIERSAKYNKQTRRYEPETFESIARQLGKVDDYESVGPDTDESYKRRSQNSKQVRPQSNVRSDAQPQQRNAYEGKSFRERNSRNERNERNNRFQQMMQGNKGRNDSKNKKDKPSK